MSKSSAAPHTSTESAVDVRQWLICAAAVVVTVPLCVVFVDRPVADMVRATLPDQRRYFDDLTHLVDPFHAFASLMLMWAIVRTAFRANLTPIEIVLLRLAVAIACAVAVKNQLKWAFGRTWPHTWVRDNPSFFRDGVYGFFPFHGGEGWASFPSGHTTIICAAVSVLWVCWPKFRALYAFLALAVMVGLLAANYHWLSDILAGAALGTAVGIVAATLGTRAERCGRQNGL